MPQVTIRAESCKSCGYCVKFCPKGVLAVGHEVNSKGYAMELCQRIGTCTNKIEPELNAIAKQIEQKIHKEYYLARMIRHGIAYHIGALPAEIRAKIESLLRKGLIKYCFCTSTLLEGVNVPADNLFVFDNKKGPSAMSTIDAFNLIGRAGRVTLNEMGYASK